MDTLAEYWKERCELAERVVEVAIKSPIETLPLANRIVEWSNFKRNAVICDDVNEEGSNEQRSQANEWAEKIDLNKLEECNGDVAEMLETTGLKIDDNEGLMVLHGECPYAFPESSFLVQDKAILPYRLSKVIFDGNQNDTKESEKH